MATQWYLKLADRELGPFSAAQLKSMADRGQIKPFDPVRTGEKGGWVAAGSVRGLLPATTAVADGMDNASSETAIEPPAVAVVTTRPTVAANTRHARRRMNARLATMLVVAIVLAIAGIGGFWMLNRPISASPRPQPDGSAAADRDAASEPLPPSKAVELDLSVVDELTAPSPPEEPPGQTPAPGTR